MEEKKETSSETITVLLRFIEDGAYEAGELLDQWARRRRYRYEGEHKLAEERERAFRAYRQKIYHLKRRKLVQTKQVEGRLLLELSQKGRVELLKRTMRERQKLPQGYTCLVVYDVPVDARAGRDAFRRFLKEGGFEQVQKSVWKSDRDVFKDVEIFVRRAKIGEWVSMYLAKTV